jgi:hypothetical protein
MGAVITSMSIVMMKLELHPGRHEEEQTPSWRRELEGNPWLHLCFCFAVLQVSMMFWGISQEYVMTQMRYPTADGGVDALNSAAFPIFLNRLFSVLFFGVVMVLRQERFVFDGQRKCIAPAISNGLASWCQYASLNFVPFAVQTTAKTTKLLPVVMLNTLRGKTQSVLDYAEAITLVAAMFVFGMETTGGGPVKSTMIGVALLIGLIFLDSLTPHFQDMVFEENPSITSAQFMFSSTLISAALFLLSDCDGKSVLLFGLRLSSS